MAALCTASGEGDGGEVLQSEFGVVLDGVLALQEKPMRAWHGAYSSSTTLRLRCSCWNILVQGLGQGPPSLFLVTAAGLTVQVHRSPLVPMVSLPIVAWLGLPPPHCRLPLLLGPAASLCRLDILKARALCCPPDTRPCVHMGILSTHQSFSPLHSFSGYFHDWFILLAYACLVLLFLYRVGAPV